MPVDLFGDDTPYSERIKPKKKTGYPYPPGTGPDGETCGTCKSFYRHELGKTYFKCMKIYRDWTHGPGTDIKFGSPACKLWESKKG
jgi:hypothetical protein